MEEADFRHEARIPSDSSDPSAPAPSVRMSPAAAVRCLAAFGCSHLAAPYLAARTMIRYSLEGSFELRYLLATVFVLAVGGALAHGQLRHQPPSRRRLYAATGIFLWVAVAGLQLVIAVDTAMSRVLLTILWALGSAWVPWAVWGAAFFGRRGTAVGTVVVALVCAGFWQIVEVTGLTGDARVEFAWRHQHHPTTVLDVPAQNSSTPQSPVLWPGYLGHGRNATVPDTEIVADWSQQPPTELWRVSCGAGWSSCSATATTLFTQEQINGEDCVTARKLSTGELIWVRSEDRTGFQSGLGGDGPRATPTLQPLTSAEGPEQLLLFAVGPTGLLQCLKAIDGTVLWTVDLQELYPGENLTHGVCASPLIDDSRVIVCPPSPNGPCLAAFDLQTGQQVWATDAGWRSSYCSPQLSQIGGRTQIVVHASPGVIGVDPENGATLWQYEWTNEWDNNATQPLPVPNTTDGLIIATGYRGGAVRLKLNRAGGKLSVSDQWQSTRTLRTKFCNMTFISDAIVGLDNGILCAVNPDDGKPLWKRGRYGHGQLLKVGDQLLIVSERGDVCLLSPDATGPHELARFTALERKTWNQPILIDDLLIVRNDRQIACFRLSLNR